MARTDFSGTIVGTGVTTFAGDGGPAINASISNPLFLKYDVSGNLYFFDAGSFRIRRVDPTGTISSIAGDGQYSVVGLNAPGPASTTPITANDLAPDGSGNLYIAGDDRITRLTPSGDLQTVARVPGAQKLAVDSSGNIYVFSNSGSGSLMRVSPAGTVLNVRGVYGTWRSSRWVDHGRIRKSLCSRQRKDNPLLRRRNEYHAPDTSWHRLRF